MSSKLYAEAKQREGALANFLKDIASIPSLSSQEGDVVKFMAEAMKKMGYDEVVIDGMGNLLGRIGDGPRVIAFDGHCDTVDIGDITLWNKVKPYPSVIQAARSTAAASPTRRAASPAPSAASRCSRNSEWCPRT
jgi:acetylornithine deacetylase/succinyl-diaminopimelate desuccinylase-like protein